MTSLDHVLTTAAIEWGAELPDSVRLLDWSPQGRLVAIAADGSALVEDAHRVTAPLTPDPRDAVWLGERSLAVVDPLAGLVMVGEVPTRALPFRGAHRIGTHGGRTVVAGDGRVAVFGHPASNAEPEVIWTGLGITHACEHVGGTIWAIGGTGGLALVDIGLGCVDQRVELPAVVRIAAHGDAGRLAASDLAGVIHVFELSDLENGIELAGYYDPVRHLALSPDAQTVVAASDDEVTRWAIDEHGTVADSPTCAVAHDTAITALESSDQGFLATGDADGVVQIWSPLLTDHPVATLQLGSEVTALAWDSARSRLACGVLSGALVIVDVVAGAVA
ncbi:MAG: WD40 repeat domain-containing protein [Ilumatobacter sp.]